MKNTHWMIVLLIAMMTTVLPWSVFAEGGEEDELSGFALFEKLRAMKLEAQAAMVKEDYVEAAKIYRRMARYEKNRARSAAYLLRGADCLMQAKKGHRALEEYTNLLENYPLYVPYEHVVEQLRQLAEWFIVGDGTFLGIKDKDTGIKIYELIIREAPAVQVTLKDRLRLAELLDGSGRGEEAVVVYQAILRQEPDNWDVRAKLALLFLKLSKNGDGDGAKLRAAVREANLVLQSNPDNPLAKDLKKLCREAESEEADRLLKNGEFYLLPAHRRPSAARRYMHDVIMKYPDSNAAKEARRLLKTNPELRALEEQNEKAVIIPPKEPSRPTPPAKPAMTVQLKPTQPAQPAKPAPAVQPKPAPVSKPNPKALEREKARKEAERIKQERELKERQEIEKAKRLKEQEKERLEAEKKQAEKMRKAAEAEHKKAAEKAAKLQAEREKEAARVREREEAERKKAAEKAAKLQAEREKEAARAKEREEAERKKAAEKAAKLQAEREKEAARAKEKEEKARQKRLEEERKARQKEEQKRQEILRREADKSAKERAKQEDEERSRIEKARQKAEGQLMETGGAKPGDHVQLVVQDRKKQEESRREAEEELKRIRERNARMLKNDPKLLEEEQKRLKELMEKNRRR
ncbi:MAG: hypothetical protein IKZ46_17760 [Victivallales bacterium]|nr:hypothetical protein [Victivallales bacterium]